MNLQQCIIAAIDIDERFLQKVPLTIAERSFDGINVQHLRWMVQQISNDMSENKAMRWLGYIQGVLVATRVATLDEMKQVSMRAMIDVDL